jgi:hypothetical protein
MRFCVFVVAFCNLINFHSSTRKRPKRQNLIMKRHAEDQFFSILKLALADEKPTPAKRKKAQRGKYQKGKSKTLILNSL